MVRTLLGTGILSRLICTRLHDFMTANSAPALYIIDVATTGLLLIIRSHLLQADRSCTLTLRDDCGFVTRIRQRN